LGGVLSHTSQAVRLPGERGLMAGSVPREFVRHSAPETFTATELMAEDLPPVKWIVPDMLPEGVTILGGKPKMGKSWMALGLGIAVASGGVALGVKPVERGEVLYLALEDNRRRLQKRLKKLLTVEAPARLHIATEWPRMDEGGAEMLSEWLVEHPEARLVVVDILKKVRPQASVHRSVYEADYEALEAMQRLAGKYGIALLVIHHLRKLGASDPLDELSGSTGLSGGADGILVLKRDRGRADAYLHVTGREIEEEAELALRWDADLASWTLAGDAEEYRRSEERGAILRVVQESPEPIAPKDVAETLDKNASTVRTLLRKMASEGLVKAESGRYTSVDTVDAVDAESTSVPESTESTQSTVYTKGPEEPTITCIHGYAYGKGCYLCDQDHPYRNGGT
jgi:AAA domain/IclR helix-turn-helix domain